MRVPLLILFSSTLILFSCKKDQDNGSQNDTKSVMVKDLAGDTVELKYQFVFQDSKTPQQTKIVKMVKVNGAWKCRETRAYDASWDDGSQPEPQP